MKKFKKPLLMLFLLCKRQLKQPILVVLLIAMPVMGLIWGSLPSMYDGGIPSVALYCADSNTTGNEAIEHIIANNAGINFYRTQSITELENVVMSREVECGFIFDDNIKNNILNGKTTGNVTLVSNGGDSVTSTVTQIVFSSIITVLTKDISIKFIQDNALFTPDKLNVAIEFFKSEFEKIYADGSSLQLEFKTLLSDQSNYDTSDMRVKKQILPVRALVGVLIFVACILGTHKWLSDKEMGVFIPMSRDMILISRFLYVLVPVLLFSISGFFTVLLAKDSIALRYEIAFTLLGMVANLVFGVILTFLIKRSRTMIALLPVLIICSLLICPVFTDLGIYTPLIRVLNKFLPPTYYMGKF